jgi:phage shock protein B
MKTMWDSARRLEDRVAALEKLLDVEAPGWRSRPL